MPRNRKAVPRDQRKAELLDAATEVFLAEGYVGTTISRISERAGVARANVYWYYESKDDVFAAVMDRMLEDEIARLAARDVSSDAYTRLTLGLAEMFPYRSLHREMHERVPYSDAVRTAHDTFMDWIRRLVYEVVDQANTKANKEVLADVIISIFEGSHAPSEVRPAHEMIPYVLKSIIGEKPNRR